MTDWNGRPAIGVALVKLVELHTRITRVATKQREDRAKRVIELLKKAQR